MDPFQKFFPPLGQFVIGVAGMAAANLFKASHPTLARSAKLGAQRVMQESIVAMIDMFGEFVSDLQKNAVDPKDWCPRGERCGRHRKSHLKSLGL